jgi:hypothetical protein
MPATLSSLARLTVAAASILVIAAGTTTAMSAAFDSGSIAPGGTYTWQAGDPGTYDVQDTAKGLMGTIVVQAGDGMHTTTSIDITASGFQPRNVTVLHGASVTWTNRDGAAHTVTDDTAMMMNKDSGDAMAKKPTPAPGAAEALALLALAALAAAARRRR